jgi:site-specific DNA-adenine methylase
MSYDITDVNLLHYFGSKFRALNTIIPYFPQFHGIDIVYIDFFMGSLIIPFRLNPRSVLLNDIDNDLYNFWNVIHYKSKEFEEEMKYVYIGKAWFDNYKLRTDDVGKAIFTYIRFYVGRGIPTEKFKNYSTTFPLVKDVQPWKQWFDSRYSLVIWNMDFRDAFKGIEDYSNRRKYIVYCDPPYEKQGYNYKHPFTEKDHKDLHHCLELIRNNPSMQILISYDDTPFIRELYNGWYITEISWCVGAGKSRSAENYHELLISNLPLIQQMRSNVRLDKFGFLMK